MKACVGALVACGVLASSATAQEASVGSFEQVARYTDDEGGAVGGRYVHRGTGLAAVVLRIESVPQVFIHVGTPPNSDRGEPHTQVHLLLGKGTKEEEEGPKGPKVMEMDPLWGEGDWGDLNYMPYQYQGKGYQPYGGKGKGQQQQQPWQNLRQYKGKGAEGLEKGGPKGFKGKGGDDKGKGKGGGGHHSRRTPPRPDGGTQTGSPAGHAGRQARNRSRHPTGFADLARRGPPQRPPQPRPPEATFRRP